MIESMTEGEFLRLSERFRHKQAARLLRAFHERGENRILILYRRVENWCALSRLPEEDFCALSDRYHMHLTIAGISWKEHNLLSGPFHQKDLPSSIPCLPIAIYLDNLRSAFNVGSILRTTEAFRLGRVCFAQRTPFIDNLKVQKTSMGTFDKVVCEPNAHLTDLPHPLIALETAPDAPSVFDFAFPDSFTLMLGNEEYGLSEESLSLRDAIVRIPLYGFKNSLNVASAFAIAAGTISHQLRSRNSQFHTTRGL
jgi:tRNA G18 (ribose-2'-O)-methylase SpoU